MLAGGRGGRIARTGSTVLKAYHRRITNDKSAYHIPNSIMAFFGVRHREERGKSNAIEAMRSLPQVTALPLGA